ncbi:unnamed protein product, partial [Rotaria sp. Silwood2]
MLVTKFKANIRLVLENFVETWSTIRIWIYIVEHHHQALNIDQRMDFEGLFSGDMGELSNMDTASHVNPIEEDNTNQSQWQQQDDLNLDDNTTTGGLSQETRTKLEECQNELDRLNSEKTNLDAQLAQMNNPVLR